MTPLLNVSPSGISTHRVPWNLLNLIILSTVYRNVSVCSAPNQSVIRFYLQMHRLKSSLCLIIQRRRVVQLTIWPFQKIETFKFTTRIFAIYARDGPFSIWKQKSQYSFSHQSDPSKTTAGRKTPHRSQFRYIPVFSIHSPIYLTISSTHLLFKYFFWKFMLLQIMLCKI